MFMCGCASTKNNYTACDDAMSPKFLKAESMINAWGIDNLCKYPTLTEATEEDVDYAYSIVQPLLAENTDCYLETFSQRRGRKSANEGTHLVFEMAEGYNFNAEMHRRWMKMENGIRKNVKILWYEQCN